ncbi:ABC transporter permease [Desulfatiglans anilini]|uniref:ABC transporter permease n=1 Tax=Desulfatiglans anilini TaxID=90728 RepID=UPI0004196D4D|nr:ABC transporter permease [Desulfatiglans anilini]
MKLLFFYSFRNLLTRRLTTFLTTGGMALVVFVFAAIVMLADGLQKTLVDTGAADNIVVIRRSALSEVQSAIERDKAAIVETDPGIALGPSGERLLAKELIVLITLQKRESGNPANVVIRGGTTRSLHLRDQITLTAGRLPHPGALEIMVGRNVAERFDNAGLGQSLFFAQRRWRVVGIFDAGNTGFSSEIWGDVDQLMQAFRRNVYSSIIFRLRQANGFDAVSERILNDPRLTLDVKRERDFYREQSEMMSKFLRLLGFYLTLIFSIGAVVGAMITMYAAVANRTQEIGTLRALGFQRGTILTAFLLESLLLGLLGGLGGLFFSSFLQFFTVSTTNFQTFSELAFRFTLTSATALKALSFALFMGFLGGILPAIQAARKNIVEALR